RETSAAALLRVGSQRTNLTHCAWDNRYYYCIYLAPGLQFCLRPIKLVRRPRPLVRNDQSDCKSLPGLKRTAFPGGIFTSEPVRGFLPMPVLRGFTENTPKPRNSIRSLALSASFMQLKMVSTACSALVLLTPVRSTIWFTRSSLITGASVSRL